MKPWRSTCHWLLCLIRLQWMSQYLFQLLIWLVCQNYRAMGYRTIDVLWKWLCVHTRRNKVNCAWDDCDSGPTVKRVYLWKQKVFIPLQHWRWKMYMNCKTSDTKINFPAQKYIWSNIHIYEKYVFTSYNPLEDWCVFVCVCALVCMPVSLSMPVSVCVCARECVCEPTSVCVRACSCMRACVCRFKWTESHMFSPVANS